MLEAYFLHIVSDTLGFILIFNYYRIEQRRHFTMLTGMLPVSAPKMEPAKTNVRTELWDLNERTALMNKNSDVSERDTGTPTYEENADFSVFRTDIKPIALYLPRYGDFLGVDTGRDRADVGLCGDSQLQPGSRQKKDSGNVQIDAAAFRKQVEFAKAHGVYGFGLCFPRFPGSVESNNPVELILENKDIEIPFFLLYGDECQPQSGDGQHGIFIQRLKKYTDDDRYIRVDGKPVIGLRGSSDPSVLREILCQWRKTARDAGIGELYILLFSSAAPAMEPGLENLADGECIFLSGREKNVSRDWDTYGGDAWCYSYLVENERTVAPANERYDCFRGIVMNWDPSAPMAGKHGFTGFSLALQELWLKEEIVYSRKYLRQDRRFLFFNALSWWGDGIYSEPDSQYGYRAVNDLSGAVFGFPYGGTVTPELMILGAGVPADRAAVWSDRLREKPLVAIQAHVFYDDLIGEVVQFTNNIPVPFDLYVSTNNQEKAERIRGYLTRFSKAANCVVEVLGNRGRDVIPFLKQMDGRIGKYDYLCHLHTKKSKHADTLGEVWREYLYENLLGSSDLVSEILNLFESDGQIGVIMPENLDLLGGCVEWGDNRELARMLMQRIHCEIDLPDNPIMFPAGDMFWMRTKAVAGMFDTGKFEDLIPEEAGQVDGTVMHAIERCWLYLAEDNGYSYVVTRSITDNRPLILSEDVGVLLHQCSVGRLPAIREASRMRVMHMLASAAGLKRACLALLWSVWFQLGKYVSVLRGIRPSAGAFYEPWNLAQMLGIHDTLQLIKLTFRRYLAKERNHSKNI